MTVYLGNTIIFSTKVDSTDIEIENLTNKTYVYECEFDFTIIKTGLNGKIYSNGQILYVKGSNPNSLRGSSAELEVYNIDLASNLDADIKIMWIDSNDTDEKIINKMVRITKMY